MGRMHEKEIMSKLQIALKKQKTSFEPGEELSGGVHWSLDQPPEKVELRLFWYTEGKATEEVGQVDREAFESPQMQETREFRFGLPWSPYSFKGELVSLVWALELVAEPSGDCTRLDFVMAPEGKEIVLSGLRKGSVEI